MQSTFYRVNDRPLRGIWAKALPEQRGVDPKRRTEFIRRNSAYAPYFQQHFGRAIASAYALRRLSLYDTRSANSSPAAWAENPVFRAKELAVALSLASSGQLFPPSIFRRLYGLTHSPDSTQSQRQF